MGAGVDAEYPTSLLGMPLIFPSNVFFFPEFFTRIPKTPDGASSVHKLQFKITANQVRLHEGVKFNLEIAARHPELRV